MATSAPVPMPSNMVMMADPQMQLGGSMASRDTSASGSRKIVLEQPSRARAEAFLEAVARSRALHGKLATPPSTQTGFEEYLLRCKSARHACFLVIDEEANAIAGVININEIVLGAFQSAYLGYYAFVPYAGKGYMRAGLERAIDYAFDELRLHRLEANIQPSNVRSIALVRSLGFEREGYSPKYLRIAGRWRDHERWALRCEVWATFERGSSAGTAEAS